MKKITTTILLLLSFLMVNAQEWQTDFEKAKEIAAEKNQKIILVFSGSDWCAPCIKLDRQIWQSDEFKTYAKDNFFLLKADFPRKKNNKLSKEQQEKNNKLAEVYNTNGYFPFVIVLDKNGTVLGTTGYKKVTPKEYINILTSF
ncbi:MAG: thioredoxin family protein [Bacteroidales bacterium]|jgi:thioredoxin-related protein|nr:thioredoxin family protein [Bacteroidales bacterium]